MKKLKICSIFLIIPFSIVLGFFVYKLDLLVFSVEENT